MLKFFATIMILFSTIVRACTCPQSMIEIKSSISLSVNNYDIIFSGTVEEISMLDVYNYIAVMSLENLFKAPDNMDPESKIITKTEDKSILPGINIDISNKNNTKGDVNAFIAKKMDKLKRIKDHKNKLYVISTKDKDSCGFDLHVGNKYIIYANMYNNIIPSITSCSRSGLSINRKKDLESIQNSIIESLTENFNASSQ